MKPTVVLVHGAFAESSSWNDVIDPLLDAGHAVISAPNPLRGIAPDSESVTDLVRSIEGPVILVGHSYGGAVITNVDRSAGDIRALVYVAGFAGDVGESCADLSGKVPGSTLAPTLQFVDLGEHGRDMYIAQDKYHAQFCADLPADEARRLAATQRPCTEAALSDPSGSDPLWKDIPSWFIYGEEDRNIPAGSHAFMAERAGSRRTQAVAGASHVVGMSYHADTAAMILEAANATELVGA
ncbi:MAG: Probable signal peptide protein [uncultured Nocardioidaceae bacterium]|uniref:Probable signal peptide protein n=1 Tax=uncultured Nocardioidaceae bacterium TaxID=253824 RepID=A0A6J4MMQ5_9ACTN|nr:MAG: Probable signal peptide protein [uncultured Nocardioidaceae bacterium]